MLKLKLNKKPAQDALRNVQSYGQRTMKFLFGVNDDWYLQRDVAQNNYLLGMRFLKQGEGKDAVLRFFLATWFDKSRTDAWIGLGRAYLCLGKRAKAEKALAKASDLPMAKKLIAAIPKVYDGAKSTLSIRKGDAATLAALHRESFAKAWDEKAFADMLAIAGTEAWVNGLKELPMGMIVGRALGEQYEIITIAVNPEWRGRGFAKQLLATLTARAKETGAKMLFLEVQENNKTARVFYQDAGYTEVNRRKDYYKQEDGTYKDAVVMQKELA